MSGWAAAERDADTAALDALLAEDFRAVGPRGFLLNKSQWLQRYETGDLVNESFDIDDVDVRMYSTTAVVNAVQMQTATHQGHPASGRFRITVVMIGGEEAWRIVNIQLSAMAQN
ncbi:nuclear transport factor 2 family protein [Nocardia anaemiae]|uniref:nuclear transport factor 2 family protein n=1 Tax=Nocardia anaemiae TaxID=263910 RepID=UPI0007A49324